MRALATLEGTPLLEGHWFNVAGGALAAVLGAFGLWLANRTLGKAAFQTAINSGFSALTEELQEERNALRSELERERLRFAVERANLRGEVQQLRRLVEGLEAMLRAHGLNVPIRPPPRCSVVGDGDGEAA